MESELLKLSMSQGLGYTLFVFLFIYVLKTTGDRERKYQSTIDRNQSIIQDLAKQLHLVEDVKKDVEDIKESLK